MLLVPPVRELAGDLRVHVRPDLRVADECHGVSDACSRSSRLFVPWSWRSLDVPRTVHAAVTARPARGREPVTLPNRARLSRRHSDCRNADCSTVEQRARIARMPRKGSTSYLAVAGARPGDPLLVPLRPSADRRQRALARARAEPEHGAPLHRHARPARLPAAGPGLEALPARPEGARPRLLGDQLDGPAGDLRPVPAAAQRRDGLHGQPGDPRRDRRRLHRALPHRPAGSAGDRPQPPRGRAAAGLLHGDGEGDPRLRPRGAARGDHRARSTSRRAGRTRSPIPRRSGRSWRGSASSGIAVNDEELAYGLRSIAAPIHSHSGEVLAALNLAVHRTMVSMDELIARYGPAVARTARDISLSMGHRLAPAERRHERLTPGRRRRDRRPHPRRDVERRRRLAPRRAARRSHPATSAASRRARRRWSSRSTTASGG